MWPFDDKKKAAKPGEKVSDKVSVKAGKTAIAGAASRRKAALDMLDETAGTKKKKVAKPTY